MPILISMTEALRRFPIALKLFAVMFSFSAHSASADWDMLLECALDRSDECVALVDRAVDGDDAKESALAKIILKDWSLHHDSEELAKAIPVWSPRPDFGSVSDLSGLESTVVVVVGIVKPDGKVGQAKIRHSSGVEEIDALCLDSFSKSLYRPARDESGWIKQPVALTCNINLS